MPASVFYRSWDKPGPGWHWETVQVLQGRVTTDVFFNISASEKLFQEMCKLTLK